MVLYVSLILCRSCSIFQWGSFLLHYCYWPLCFLCVLALVSSLWFLLRGNPKNLHRLSTMVLHCHAYIANNLSCLFLNQCLAVCLSHFLIYDLYVSIKQQMIEALVWIRDIQLLKFDYHLVGHLVLVPMVEQVKYFSYFVISLDFTVQVISSLLHVPSSCGNCNCWNLSCYESLIPMTLFSLLLCFQDWKQLTLSYFQSILD